MSNKKLGKTVSHSQYTIDKENETIRKYEIHMLGKSKGDFTDFEVENDFEQKILIALKEMFSN